MMEWWNGGMVEWWSGGVVEWWSERGLSGLDALGRILHSHFSPLGID
jgi:hypothetical protein